MDGVLLDLLLNEVNKGNRPDQTFSSLAYRNIVNRFNELYGTKINKDNVKKHIRMLKSTFGLFHEAFHAMSGFVRNCETKKLEATKEVWDERVKVISLNVADFKGTSFSLKLKRSTLIIFKCVITNMVKHN